MTPSRELRCLDAMNCSGLAIDNMGYSLSGA